MTKLAAIQMASGPNVTANLDEAERLISTAVEQEAELVVLPENFALMGMSEQDKLQYRETFGSGLMQDFLAEQAKRHQIWLVGGSIPLDAGREDKVFAACLVYDDKGECQSRYDKIHLFDVDLIDCKSDERYEESETLVPGDKVAVVDTPFGRLGLAICYDIRFPELFRAMVDLEVDMIAIPSAFTAPTGKAHWECLVRTRAIENQSCVIAAAQGGYHVNGRETHGNSMIVDAWGTILGRQASGSGVVVAEFDSERQVCMRRNFPTLKHRQLDYHLVT